MIKHLLLHSKHVERFYANQTVTRTLFAEQRNRLHFSGTDVRRRVSPGFDNILFPT